MTAQPSELSVLLEFVWANNLLETVDEIELLFVDFSCTDGTDIGKARKLAMEFMLKSSSIHAVHTFIDEYREQMDYCLLVRQIAENGEEHMGYSTSWALKVFETSNHCVTWVAASGLFEDAIDQSSQYHLTSESLQDCIRSFNKLGLDD